MCLNCPFQLNRHGASIRRSWPTWRRVIANLRHGHLFFCHAEDEWNAATVCDGPASWTPRMKGA